MNLIYHNYVCECGCGELVLPGLRFVRGHNMRVQENVGDRVRGVPKTEEDKEVRRETLKRKYASGELVGCWTGKSSPTLGMTWEEIHGEEKAAEMKSDILEWAHTEEARKKQSETLKETYQKQGGGLNHPEGCTCGPCKASRGEQCGENNPFYGHHHTRDSITKAFLAVERRPTSWEKLILNLIEQNDLPFKYTGDGTFWVTSKKRHINPDFVDTKKNKIAIEVFADFWKLIDYKSVENYLKDRSDLFEEIDWKVIFIHDEDINRDDWESHCLNLIRSI